MKEIIKRDGSIVDFDGGKIQTAIEKALRATNEDPAQAKEISSAVVEELERRFGTLKPSVEDIQDIVEQKLIDHGKYETAKAYIIYRAARTQLRYDKKILGYRDTLKLPLNSLRVLEARYLRKDPTTGQVESPADMFRRVAHAIAQADNNYQTDAEETEERFYQAMVHFEFLPNSPTLMNAGTNLGQLSACFVIPVEDSLESIFSTLKHAALIHQSGGGTGFSFAHIRPRGDIVRSTMGVASGPLSFMKIYDRATEIIKQGGMRRGANMGIMSVTHPDIISFITAKDQENVLRNFNISVALSDDFMTRVSNNQSYELINPRNKQRVKVLPAKDIFDLIVMHAWKTGDPGVIYLDEINRGHPLTEFGEIEATNPCGEVPLLPYESCNLGSIVLTNMFTSGQFDYKKLGETVTLAVHFLDNVIECNHYPLPDIDAMTKGNRKIGLGVMGFADCLIKMNIPYNSQEALDFAAELMNRIQHEARKASAQLGESRGSFPNIEKSIFRGKNMRNATVTSIAPTGSISTIADVSSGIEPLFSVGYLRHALDTTLLVVNPLFEEIARRKGFYSSDLMAQIVNEGSIQRNTNIPPEVRRIFPVAHDIQPEFHVKMQAMFQRYVDNAVSKTINLPENATLDQTRSIFHLAHKLKCKGVTIYRYGSKELQALEFGDITQFGSCSSGVCNT